MIPRKNVSTAIIVLQILLMVVASASAGATPGGVAGADERSGVVAATEAVAQNDTNVQPADTVYVMENGDAVLAYEGSGSSDSTVEYGADMTKGLVHMLVSSETRTEVTGNGSLVLTPSSLVGDGSLTAPRPDAVKSLQVDVTGKQTEDVANLDATVDAKLAGGTGGMGLFQSVETSGKVKVTADAFTTSGQFTADTGRSSGRVNERRYGISETDDGYTVNVDRRSTITRWSKQSWETKERAMQTLQRQYGMLAQQLGGSSSIAINSYSFEQRGDRYLLDIDYTVKYTGVDDGLSNQLTKYLSQSGEFNMTEEEAQSVGEAIANLEVRKVNFGMSRKQGTTSVDWDVEIGNYADAVSAGLDVAQSVSTDEMGVSDSDIEKARTRFEAQQAANLEQTVTWSGDVSRSDSGELTVSAEAHYDTKNWGAYIDELKNSGIDQGSVTFELHAQTEGEDITSTVSLEVKQNELVSQMTDTALSSLGSSADVEGMKYLEAFQKSGFRKAKMDLSSRNGTVEFEAGAKFDNMSAFRDAVEGSYGGMTVTSAVGRTEDGSTTTYVRVEGLVDGDASKADVRAKAVADDDTEIKMAGEWDREFPSMNSTQASNYLGIEATQNEQGMPGFGAGVAVVALAVAFLAMRRD